MIKAVIFDMDGVLIDSESVYLGIFRQYLEANGIFVEQSEINKMAGCSLKMESVFLTKWWNENKHERKTEEEVDSDLRKFCRDFEKKNRIVYTEIQDVHAKKVMEALKEQGYMVAIASSSPMVTIKKVVNETGFNKYVDLIVSGEMFTESKPNPEIYMHTIQELRLKPEECMAVEDSTYGIAAAKSAGAVTVAKIDQRFDFDQEAADYKVKELTEILTILNA